MKQNLENKSGHSKVQEKQEAALKAEANKMAQLARCVAVATASAEGIVAFRQLMIMCGYNQSALNVNPQTGQVNEVSTIYNVARENIWKEFRQLIPIVTRKKIENEKTIYLKENENA